MCVLWNHVGPMAAPLVPLCNGAVCLCLEQRGRLEQPGGCLQGAGCMQLLSDFTEPAGTPFSCHAARCGTG